MYSIGQLEQILSDHLQDRPIPEIVQYMHHELTKYGKDSDWLHTVLYERYDQLSYYF